jgi:hypothetical protein
VDRLSAFRQVWAVDFEFTAQTGERPIPLCCVARELRTGRLERHWLADGAGDFPPYATGPQDLLVAYYASAEMGCHLALGWPMPARILDLFVEFRRHTSGLSVPCGNGLLGALAYFGLDGLTASEKEGMRQLAMRGGPYTVGERETLMDYCQSDVDALVRLLPVMLPVLDVPRALLRGRYMAAAARMEFNGVPIDTDTLAVLRDNWNRIKGRLIGAVDADYGVFVRGGERPADPEAEQAAGPPGGGETFGPARFSSARWALYLTRRGIPWPRLASGALALDDDTFREMAKLYPAEVGPIRELRHALGQLRLNELAVGRDGRNRCLLSAFASKTGRNQPSNSKFIFGPSTWLRSLIRPAPGRAVVYCDYAAQEYGIAAALSADEAMQHDYRGGDPYLSLAKRAGAVPADATKQTHARERELFKVCCGLGAMYGAGEHSLAARLGISAAHARELLQLHRRSYPDFWRWSDNVLDFAMLHGYLETVFGWRVHVGPNANPRSLRNFLMQANGAEMLRLACCLATERGIQVCGPVHDALVAEGPADSIETVVAETQRAMREASELVLPGFPLRTDAKIVRYPDRYMDGRGQRMWETVWALLEGLGVSPYGTGGVSPNGTGTCTTEVHPSPLISSLMSCLSS